MQESLIACHNCGTLHKRVQLYTRAAASCTCCGTVLYKRGFFSIQQWQALAWTGLILFAIAQYFPIVVLSVKGLEVSLTFWQSLRLAWDRGSYLVSVIAGLIGFWFPLLQICLTLWLMQAITKRRLPPDFTRVLRLLGFITPWSMASVLVLAIMVALVKMAGIANYQLGYGMLGFIAMIFFIAGLASWDAKTLWRYAEDYGLVSKSGSTGMGAVCDECGCVQAAGRDYCLRCHAKLGHKSSNSVVWALLISALILYIPANVLPMMRIKSLVGDSDHTILGGVIELWQMGSWDLAFIVFIASVLVPITKIVSLAYLLIRGKPDTNKVQKQRTRLFVAVESIGHWSMLDVFVVILMAAMADFPGISQINIGPAALSFGAVVILTMLAAMSYDPRQGWQELKQLEMDNNSNE